MAGFRFARRVLWLAACLLAPVGVLIAIPPVTAQGSLDPTPTPIPTAIGTAPATPESRTVNNLTEITMVMVPPGCFMMGSTDQQVQDAYNDAKKREASITTDVFKPEQPAHTVCITKGFWIDQYDVTNAAYYDFIKAGGYHTDAYWSADGLAWRQAKNITGPGQTDDGKLDCAKASSDGDQPRVCISWYEAQAYATWRTQTAQDGFTYRLPTEAEWEYAARGPQALIYPWGNTFKADSVNFCDKRCTEVWRDTSVDDGYTYASPVGHYPDNKSWVGAYDMAGNVWQWTVDWYSATYFASSPANDPLGPESGTYRVVRGGAFLSTPHNTRAAGRSYTHFPSDGRRIYISFRLVATIASQ